MRKKLLSGLSGILLCQLVWGVARAQGRYVEKCTSQYCVFKCVTGQSLVIVSSSSDGKGARVPDWQTFKYGSQVFALPSTTMPGANYAVYGDVNSPRGIEVVMGRDVTLRISGKQITCRPAWL